MRAPASRAVQVGLVLFVLGLVGIAVDFLPFFLGDRNTPLWLNLVCMLAPVGAVVCVWSVVRDGRRQQRAAAAAVRAGYTD